MRVIYIDVLLGLNLFINYFLLLSCARFLLLPVNRKRLIIAACVGAIYSLCILLPEAPPLVSLFLKFAASLGIVRIAWPWQGRRLFMKEVCIFYLTNFAFAGFMIAVWYIFSPSGLLIRNSIVYFSISPLLFLCITVLSYGLIRLLQRLTGREEPKTTLCRLEIQLGNSRILCNGKVDTGNSLTEPFSGFPVVVLDKEKAASFSVPEEKIRLIPFHTVNGSGVLSAFRPDLLLIQMGKENREYKDVYIAVSTSPVSAGEFSALINPQILL